MILDHQGPSGKYLAVEICRPPNIYGDLGLDCSNETHSFKKCFPGLREFLRCPAITVVSYEYSSTSCTAVSYIQQTEKSRVYLSTTTTKYCCIASDTSVVSYKTALPVLPIIIGDFTNDSGNFTSDIKGLKKFDGRTPSDFRDWHKRLAVVLGVTRRGIASLIKEKARPTEESFSAGISHTLAMRSPTLTGPKTISTTLLA